MSRVIKELDDFQDNYRTELCLKSGRLSSLYLCTDRHKSEKCVVKVIDYSNISFTDQLSVAKDIRDECHTYENLVHKHITQIYESFIFSDRIIFFVYEFIECNDLLVEIVNRVNAGYVYSENVISYYMNQIMEAINFCHNSNIIHGNIKAENILISNKESATVKLCGFGRSLIQNHFQQSPVHYYQRNNLFDCLPDIYWAPELTQENALFSKYSDIYSCGILLLTLLCGSALNFDRQINFFSIEEKIWNNISETAKELVIKMLTPNPNSRITAEEALNHKWLSEKELFARKAHLTYTIEEMRRFNHIRTLKKNISFICFAEKLDQNMSFHNNNNNINNNNNNKFDDKEYQILVGVKDVIQSLDKVISLSSINSRQDFVIDLVSNDSKLKQFLNLFDFIYKSIKEWKQSVPELSAFETYEEVLQILESLPLLPSSDTTVIELLDILYSPYIQLLLKTQDIVRELEINELNGDSSSVGTNSNHFESTQFSQIESIDDNLTPIRLVRFQKNSNQPMGITLKLDLWGRCVVSRIMHGGLIHRQGTLHVGDVIQEINDIPVSNQSVDSLQRLLKDNKRNVFSFKILPNCRQTVVPIPCQTYFRTQFDYNPKDDELIPSVEAGLTFNTGDILEVISKDDYYWWQSRKEGDKGSAGLIPSPELVEWRATQNVCEKSKKDGPNCAFFSKKKKRDKYYAKRNALFDCLDIPSYEEVVYLSSFKRKTLVLLGAHGIGRRHIKNTLISNNPDKYSYPIPHTTRSPRRGEKNGKHYFFISEEQMLGEIASNQFLEYGSHEEAMYGTKVETIRQIIASNRIPILDVEPQALKILRSAEFTPFVIYIGAPSPSILNIEDSDGSLKRLTRESELLHNSYKHLFDLSLINNDIEETVKLVEKSFNQMNSCGQWVPCNWIY